MRKIIPVIFLIFLASSQESAFGASARKNDMTLAEQLFLKGDYARARSESDRLISVVSQAKDKEEMHYIKSLSLMKLKRYVDARNSFGSMAVGFPKGSRRVDALTGIGDTYYLEGDYGEAIKSYEAASLAYPEGKNQAPLYYRLGNCYNSSGIYKRAIEYFSKARALAPAGFEERMIPAVDSSAPDASCGELPREYFSVQLGAFKARANAEGLADRLKGRYSGSGEAYIETDNPGVQDALYKVRLGKFNSRQEAEDLAARLEKGGYDSKTCP